MKELLIILLILQATYTAIVFVHLHYSGGLAWATIYGHVTTIIVTLGGIVLAILIVERQLRTQYEAGVKLQTDAIRDQILMELYRDLAQATARAQRDLTALLEMVVSGSLVIEYELESIPGALTADYGSTDAAHNAVLESMAEVIVVANRYRRVSSELMEARDELENSLQALEGSRREWGSLTQGLRGTAAIGRPQRVRIRMASDRYADAIEALLGRLLRLDVSFQNAILGKYSEEPELREHPRAQRVEILNDKKAQLLGLVRQDIRRSEPHRSQGEYVDMALNIWDRHPEQALLILENVELSLSPRQISSLVLGSAGSPTDDYLSHVMRLTARRHSNKAIGLEVSKQILEHSEYPVEQKRAALVIWLGALESVQKRESVVEALTVGAEDYPQPIQNMLLSISGLRSQGVALGKQPQDHIISAGAAAVWSVELNPSLVEEGGTLVVREKLGWDFAPDVGMFGPEIQVEAVASRVSQPEGTSTTSEVHLEPLPSLSEYVLVYTLTVGTPSVPGIYCTTSELISIQDQIEEVLDYVESCIVTTGQVVLEVQTTSGALQNGEFYPEKEHRALDSQASGSRDALVFLIEIVNQSVYEATNIVLEARIVNGDDKATLRQVVEGSPSIGQAHLEEGLLLWSISVLGGGELAMLQVRAEARNPGIVQNRVEVTADQLSGRLVDIKSTQIIR